MVELTREAIDSSRLADWVRRPDAGGVVLFGGDVRREGSGDNALAALEYSAHEEMALEQMGRLRERALAEFDVCEVGIIHRVGRVEIGERSVAVAISAPHREAAFSACRFVIDTLKRDVPIWKKEVWAGGRTAWADPTGEPERTKD